MSISLLSHQLKKRRNVFRKRGETWRKCSVCKSSNLFVALTLEMQRHCCCTLLLLVSNLGIGSSVLQLRPPHCVLSCRVRSLYCFVVYFFIPISGSRGGPWEMTHRPDLSPWIIHLLFSSSVPSVLHRCLSSLPLLSSSGSISSPIILSPPPTTPWTHTYTHTHTGFRKGYTFHTFCSPRLWDVWWHILPLKCSSSQDIYCSGMQS